MQEINEEPISITKEQYLDLVEEGKENTKNITEIISSSCHVCGKDENLVDDKTGQKICVECLKKELKVESRQKCAVCGSKGDIQDKKTRKWICFDCLNKRMEYLEKNRKKPIIVQKQQGRNEMCSCGSGKKYKNCCL